ncbi:MAG TPA: HAD family phosphatase [Bellilinea sp.]|nr:HAD family phosphatase [Bellilinea sp.]
MIKAFIFDFDGLILDTETPIYRAWADVYEENGYKLRLIDWEKSLGSADANFDVYGHLLDLVNKPLDEEAIRLRVRNQYMSEINASDTLPGIRELIDGALERGIRLSVGSSADRRWLDRHLTRLGLIEKFKVIVSMDDVTHVKPSPEIFNKVVADLGLKSSECVVFEDSPNGIRAAHAAGIKCVTIPNTISSLLDTSTAEIKLARADEITIDELLARLND